TEDEPEAGRVEGAEDADQDDGCDGRADLDVLLHVLAIQLADLAAAEVADRADAEASGLGGVHGGAELAVAGLVVGPVAVQRDRDEQRMAVTADERLHLRGRSEERRVGKEGRSRGSM